MLNTEADQSYFRWSRREIAPLLPAEAPRRILEIGCSSGATLAWLKGRYPQAETVGLEGFASMLEQVSQNADRAVIHDLEQPLPADLGRFDLILALDVLEHLRDPADVLKRLVPLLESGGRVIVSVPNLSHHSVVRDLIFRRRFAYQEAGIMDRTHLRWFTESSAVGLMNGAGLTVVAGVVNGWNKRRSKLVNTATAGLFKHFFAEQYIMAGVTGMGQKTVDWQTGAP